MTPADLYHGFGEMLESLARDDLADGRKEEARIHAQRAYIAFRAERAEIADPEPRLALSRAWCCTPCHVYHVGDAAKTVPRLEMFA